MRKSRAALLAFALLGFPPSAAAAQSIRPGLERQNDLERDNYGEADRVLDLVQAAPGQRAAVVGAGDGYYVLHLAQRLGPTAELVAEDDDPGYLARLRLRLDDAGLPSVRLVTGTPDDPRLPPGSADLVIADHLYARLPRPDRYFRRLQSALSAGGRLAIVEDAGLPGRPAPDSREVRCSMSALGFRELQFQPLMPAGSWVVVLTPDDKAAPPQDAGCGSSP